MKPSLRGRIGRSALCLLLACPPVVCPSLTARCFAQAGSFAVATIRPSAAAVQFEHDGKTDISPDSLHMQDVTVNTCIKLAYGVQDSQISGPAWLNAQHYDIMAKSDGPVDETQMKLLLRTLLTERFQLSFHRDSKEMKAFVLTVAKSGAKLTPAAAPDAKSFRQNSANGTVARSIGIQEFADFISGPLQMPVVDRTGLKGKYDFALDFTPYLPDPTHNMDGTKMDTTSILMAALDGELGLKMTTERAPVQVMVIDHVEKPSAN
jgi:uncharacterized protein (TIGR03435 family)